jgi:hypothetical protein
VGTPGALYLNGVDYDSCPIYQIGQISPDATILPVGDGNGLTYMRNRLAITGCTMFLNQDWSPITTKLQFDVWSADEVKFSGAYGCADSWHETKFYDMDSAGGNFTFLALGTESARYRVQGVKSTQCWGSQAVGILAVQSSLLMLPNAKEVKVGSTLTAAGKFLGKVIWDAQGVVPEGGVR